MDCQILNKLGKAPLLVRRFGLLQGCRLLFPELIRASRFSGLLGRFLGRHVERFRMRDSTVLLLRPFSMDLGIFHEIWDHERYTMRSIGRVARDGVVVDVGAHIGLFSLFASRVLMARTIVSVEPDPTNFDLLSKNLSLNRIENATVINVAVAGESGEKLISFDQFNTGGHSFFGRSMYRTPVRTVSLRELFESSGVLECSLLKVDCEGAEMEIFENAPESLLRKVSAFSLEYHLYAYPSERLERFVKRMEGLGFAVEVQPTSKTLGIASGIRRA